MRAVPRRLAVAFAASLMFISGLSGITSTSATAAPADSAAAALPAEIFRLDEVGAAARMKLRSSGSAEELAAETFADIECRSTPFRLVREKGWGVAYPRSTDLTVIRDLFIDGDWWKSLETYPRTSSSGSWSTPTTDHATFLGGDHMLWVTAYYRNGARIGRATDVCDF